MVMISTTGRRPSIAAPIASADEALLGDRRVADPLRAELLQQPGGDLVGALEDADLLAHQEDVLVARQLLAQRVVQRLAVGDDGHGLTSAARRQTAESTGLSPGRPSASSFGTGVA